MTADCTTCGYPTLRPGAHADWCARVTVANRAAIEQAYPGYRTHCIHGHEYTPENTYRKRDGTKSCRACKYGNATPRSDRGTRIGWRAA